MTEPSRQERIADCVQALTSKPDFPTFSEHVQKILAIVDNTDTSARQLTNLIIRDYSLSLRVLRTANSAFYNLSGKPILSITHAVVLIGMQAVRHLAGSLMIFDHFSNKPAPVQQLMVLSMLTANHVRELALHVPGINPEEAYLCGMVRNLGEVLASYYLPVHYAKILETQRREGISISAACLEVLQFTFEDFGAAVARYWCMPDRITTCQRAEPGPAGLGDPEDTLLLSAVSLGHLMTMAVYRPEPETSLDLLKARLLSLGAVFPLSREELEQILRKAISDTRDSFAAVNIHIDERHLEAQARRALDELAGVKPAPENDEPGVPRRPNDDTLERLTREACALLESPAEFQLPTFILMVLEALYRGLAFDRVIFAFVNQERTHVEGRVGLGEDVDSLIGQFRFRMSMSGGPVSVALLCKRGVVVDARRDKANEIAKHFECNYLVLYPIVVAQQVIGCIYMDNKDFRTGLTATQLHVLDELRDALTTAIQRLRQRA